MGWGTGGCQESCAGNMAGGNSEPREILTVMSSFRSRIGPRASLISGFGLLFRIRSGSLGHHLCLHAYCDQLHGASPLRGICLGTLVRQMGTPGRTEGSPTTAGYVAISGRRPLGGVGCCCRSWGVFILGRPPGRRVLSFLLMMISAGFPQARGA